MKSFKDFLEESKTEENVLNENRTLSNIKSDLISIERNLSSFAFRSKDKNIKKKLKELEDKLTKIRREIHDLI